ncbi:mitogen-activated kinase kinase kinase NPK1 isoform X1 [Chlorella sorokiniana]|uniref:mitogen-activated protein kinase kinase kinase n=1 Tax=Chlorella sorokiniana TaxID=3076 RepID=A0A2P6U4A5_CHLSO|nr:mitogen-activated kinase kinase kinase NPK1 isoform X1 [Chlorella sorokiniana]|eukprot:PRW61141.1 mitogen-activated kinase kinase kinase NPK1 isoform X1 [Chlorella sorokiniana]
MGQCLSAHQPGSTPERFKGRWAQQGGLGDGLAAFDAKYGGGLGAEPAQPAYTTTADVGLKAREDSKQYAFLNDKPAPLQLDRIDEDAALQAGPEASPLKPGLGLGLDGVAVGVPPLPSGDAIGRPQRKPISWTKGELVGQGAFGSVCVAMDNDTGELIAVKQVHVPRGAANSKKVEENVRSLEEEVQLLQQFDHPNIVRYLGTEKTEDSLNIFLEYVPGGSIASLLAKFGSFKESVIKVYTKQILLGLEYLHSKGVMHRDIKGANILVDNTGLVKLADFGASKKLEDLVTVADGNKSVRGTPYWMAPEVITQTGHGRQADLWSVACTVLEMATGRPPWSTQYPSQVAAMFHIASSKGPPEIPQHLSPECKDFLYLCFNRDWKARPAASTLLRHPFLADVARQRPGVQDHMASAGAAAASPVAPDSAGTSSGTNKSDYNPMEEPSWLHPAESPVAGEGTPTSAITAASGGPAASTGQRVTDAQEVASYAQEGCAALQSLEAAEAAGPAAEPAPPSELPVPLGSHRSGEHMVWTNEDGDIDALPWDMGGWSTGSSSERDPQQQQQQQSAAPADEGQEQRQPGAPVDEDALIGALRRKAQHDVRASLALFEKSLNIPAVHVPPLSPKVQHAQPLSPGSSRGGIAAARCSLPALAVPLPPDAEPADQLVSAESIEGRLGYGSGGPGGAGGADREAVWQQELSQELFRVKASTAVLERPHRRASMHGSPLKRGL